MAGSSGRAAAVSSRARASSACAPVCHRWSGGPAVARAATSRFNAATAPGASAHPLPSESIAVRATYGSRSRVSSRIGAQSGSPSPRRAAAIASVRTIVLGSRRAPRTSAARSGAVNAPVPLRAIRRASSSRSRTARTAVALSSPPAAASVSSDQPPDDRVRRPERRAPEQVHARGRERARGPARPGESVEPVHEAGRLPDREPRANGVLRGARRGRVGQRQAPQRLRQGVRDAGVRLRRQRAGENRRGLARAERRAAGVGRAAAQPPERLRHRIRRLGADGRVRVGQRREQAAPQLRPLKAAQPAHREAPQQCVAAGQRREQRIESLGPGPARVLRHEEALEEGGVHRGAASRWSRRLPRGK